MGSGADFTDKGEMQGYRVYSNLGSNQGSWYTQVGLSYLDQDYYRLPNSFEPTTAEDGGRRNNSYNSDGKLNLKVGLYLECHRRVLAELHQSAG